MTKALGKEGPLAIAFKRKQYYKNYFNIVDPVEFVLDAKANKNFQYVPLLKVLQQLLNQKDVLSKVIEKEGSNRE